MHCIYLVCAQFKFNWCLNGTGNVKQKQKCASQKKRRGVLLQSNDWKLHYKYYASLETQVNLRCK